MVYPVEGFYSGEIQDKLSSNDNGFLSFEGGSKESRFGSSGEEWGESGMNNGSMYCGDYGSFYQDVSSKEGFVCSKYNPHQQQRYSDCGLDNLRFDMASPPLQTCMEEISKLSEIRSETNQIIDSTKKGKQALFSLASLELLKNYGNGVRRLNGERRIEPSTDMITRVQNRKLSTEEIMRVAGERFIRSSLRTVEDVMSMLGNPIDLSFSGLSDEEIRDVELAELLFAAAEKVGDQQYERAIRLLNQCDCLSSPKGNPVQRVVYYFSEALRDKINRETGRVTPKEIGKSGLIHMEVEMMKLNSTNLACYEELPFAKVTQFAGIQAICENLADAKKIHIVDLAIRNGVQWTILLQALVSRIDCPVELLKITAVGDSARNLMEDTGKRLTNFAESMNIPFSFNIVMVSDMLDVKEELLEIDPDEKVAVFAQFYLRTYLALPNRLENIMKVLRNINPCVMVVAEVEANHNSPVFVNRFIEAFFFFSAYFDCLESCMIQNEHQRMIMESVYFSRGIRNIVAHEGEERNIRNVKLDVWRAFFARYGMEETELSMSSMYQVNLVLQQLENWKFCTVHVDGKSLISSWKGTPTQSLSVWKFI